MWAERHCRWSAVRPHASVTIESHSNTSILDLVDDSSSWKPGDTVVVASTDYSMHQAEEFLILPCRTCANNQVKVQGQSSSLAGSKLIFPRCLSLTHVFIWKVSANRSYIFILKNSSL